MKDNLTEYRLLWLRSEWCLDPQQQKLLPRNHICNIIFDRKLKSLSCYYFSSLMIVMRDWSSAMELFLFLSEGYIMSWEAASAGDITQREPSSLCCCMAQMDSKLFRWNNQWNQQIHPIVLISNTSLGCLLKSVSKAASKIYSQSIFL